MKIALYRKYRPRRFDDVVGQDAAVTALKNQVRHGRIGHAYIFTGIRGTGKTSLAKILAKAVNCPDVQDGDPCGVCDICTGIDNGSMLDVTEIDAASNNGVDYIRALREETAYYPAVCNMRVYIIDEVHMLTREAFNALLKIMEEPPAHVLFILATTEVHKVPATILSRCQRFDLRRISNKDIQKKLADIAGRENIDLAPEAADLIARLADGALRDALSLLDTCSSLGGAVDEATVAQLAGVADKSYLFELADAIAQKDLQRLFEKLAALYAGSVDPTRLCLELIRHYRNLLMMQVSGPPALADCSADDIARYQKQAAAIAGGDILRALDELSVTADKLTTVPDRMLALELCFVKLCSDGAVQSALSDDVPWDVPPAKTKKPKEKKTSAPPPETAPTVESDTPETKPNEANGLKEDILAADGVQLFAQWKEVVDSLLPVNGMLYGFLQKSRAYLSDTHVLIEADDFFLQHMRQNAQAKNDIKDALAKVAGIQLPIGPYAPDAKKEEMAPVQEDDDIEDLLARAAQSGVDIEITE